MAKIICCCRYARKGCKDRCGKWEGKRKPDEVINIPQWRQGSERRIEALREDEEY
jgi:hypothetical protein